MYYDACRKEETAGYGCFTNKFFIHGRLYLYLKTGNNYICARPARVNGRQISEKVADEKMAGKILVIMTFSLSSAICSPAYPVVFPENVIQSPALVLCYLFR